MKDRQLATNAHSDVPAKTSADNLEHRRLARARTSGEHDELRVVEGLGARAMRIRQFAFSTVSPSVNATPLGNRTME